MDEKSEVKLVSVVPTKLVHVQAFRLRNENLSNLFCIGAHTCYTNNKHASKYEQC